VRKERDLNLPGITAVAERILGSPLQPRDSEHLRIRKLRDLLAQPNEHPDEHLGEAETVTIIEMRSLDAIIVTDDGSAANVASGIPCVTTWDIARTALRANLLTQENCIDLWNAYIFAGGKPPRYLGSREGFIRHLNQ